MGHAPRATDGIGDCTYNHAIGYTAPASRSLSRGAVTHLADLPEAIQELYPEDIRALYEIHEWRNASVVFHGVRPQEFEDLMTVLSEFRLKRSHVAVGGGNRSLISRSLDGHLYRLGWEEKHFDTKITVDETVYETPTHSVDCFKNRVALEVEWNNKDPFYDRDLNNFRLLFELRAIDLGIIITRTDDLQTIFRQLGRGSSFGEATTHMRKLLPKIDGGGAGGCPVIVFGISPALYVEDDEPVSPVDVAEAKVIDLAEVLRDYEEE
jgi:hypothetical protein